MILLSNLQLSAETEDCLWTVGFQVSQLLPRRDSQPSVTSLHPRAEWVAGLTSGLKEVMNSESLELQSLFKSDHMVGLVSIAKYTRTIFKLLLRCP